MAKYRWLESRVKHGFSYKDAIVQMHGGVCNIGGFTWDLTSEGYYFWYNIFFGKVPNNLIARLILFDMEMYRDENIDDLNLR